MIINLIAKYLVGRIIYLELNVVESRMMRTFSIV